MTLIKFSQNSEAFVIRDECAAGFEEKNILDHRGGRTDRHTTQEPVSSHDGDNSYCSRLDYDTAYSGRCARNIS
jgi:hypothetical protein